MNEVKATLHFQAALKKGQENVAPSENGIYVAFACKQTVRNSKLGWQPMRTVYIGKAEGEDTVMKRISDHINDRDEADPGKQSYWEKHYCHLGETIVYSYAKHNTDLHDIEALLIYLNKPEANQQGKDAYLADADVVEVTCVGNRGPLGKGI